MIYGKEYGKEPKACEQCEQPVSGTSRNSEDCYSCGLSACTGCLHQLDFGTCSETGYHDVKYLCDACMEQHEAKEPDPDRYREDRL